MLRWMRAGTASVLLALLAWPASGGVTNPNLSIIGQPSASWTDDPSDPDRLRGRLDPGEVEVVFDDYLNPYARAFFTLTLGEEGMELEEGYFTLFRGLPLDLALRGGQYRVPFGRMNPIHPHANPFAEPPLVIQAYLPGEEATIEPGIDLSRRFPLGEDLSVNAQVEWLQGDAFRIERETTGDPGDPLESGGDDDIETTRAAVLGRLSAFTMIGELSALELGVSAAQGTNNVAARARTTLIGVDAKAKLWRSPRAYLLLQGEAIRMEREDASWEPGLGYSVSTVNPAGAYVYADYNFNTRYNLGLAFERFQEPIAGKPWTRAVGAFAGFALLEESTAFRLDWRSAKPEDGNVVNTVTLRAIFSLGPHKAHQF
jgi:hypothetical protein